MALAIILAAGFAVAYVTNPGAKAAHLAIESAPNQQPVAGCGASFAQAPGSPISVGREPGSVVAGDFNLDGKPDLAVANALSDNVTILLGQGNGGFSSAAGSPFSVGDQPVSVAVGDFNLDGKPDLAVANRESANLTILLGTGTGGFTQAAGSPFNAGGLASFVAVGDFNLDSKPDLAVTNPAPGNVAIWLGNGNGGFAAATGSPVSIGTGGQAVVVGEFNLDGKSDLAITNSFSNNLIILLGNGSGGFAQAAGSPISVGTLPRALVTGDFNSDGKPDLAVANVQSGSVTILLGNGGGGFTPAAGSPVSLGSDSTNLLVKDFNLDGKSDLAVVSSGPGNVTVLLGNGTGGFTTAAGSPTSAGSGASSIAAGDFNLDGKPDLAIANSLSNDVTIRLNTCDTRPCAGITFSQPAGSPIRVGTFPYSIAKGDFNLDGNLDLAVANHDSNNVTILLGGGNGGFTQPANSPVNTGGNPRFVAVGDFNLDGKPDLATANWSNSVTILIGDGHGGFIQAAGSPISVGGSPSSVATEDFNLDGKPDLAVVSFDTFFVTVLVGNGTGGFTQTTDSPGYAGIGPSFVATGDLNLDGKPDAATASYPFGAVTVSLGNGSGGFTNSSGIRAGSNTASVAVGDFNLDGKPDLAAPNYNDNFLTLILGQGTSGFTQSSGLPIPTAIGSRYAVVGDFNLDGKPDLATQSELTNSVVILLGNGAGGFIRATGSLISTGSLAFSAVLGDFNHDGKPDLAIANAGSNSVTIQLNTCNSNTPPLIGEQPVRRIAGEASINSTIAFVNDAQDARGTLSVKINGGTSATVNGVTISNLTVDAGGTVRADVIASANATEANFTLRVTDSGGLFSETTLNVFVVGLTVTLSDPAVCLGPGGVVGVTAQVGNPNAAQATATFTATPDANLRVLAGTCIASVGTCSVNANTNQVEWNGTLGAGQSATISYQTQVTNNVPAGADVCVSSTASLNSGQAGSVTACTKVNCPSVGPGALLQAVSPMSDGRAGSVLIYNLYTSAATGGEAQNTRLAITNTHPQQAAFVHLFFVTETCAVADSFLCLTANQTSTFLASDLDPGTSGYLVAVATDARGCPANFNFLIGDEYVKLTSGHAANLNAEAITAIAGGLPLCDANSVTAQINFDGLSYAPVPRVLALSNLASRADGNDTLLVLNRIGGNLGLGASTLGSIFGILYDDAERGLSFSFSGNCQLRSSINNNFPRTAPRVEQVIPAGRNGWMRLYSQSDFGITGAAINANSNAASTAGAFNQGHNLHTLTLTTAAGYVIPVFPPNC